MTNKNIIGIDLGGTNIRGGVFSENKLSEIMSQKINGQVAEKDVLEQFFAFSDKLINPLVAAIGIGVPGLVDPAKGMIYDLVNIPSCKEVPLKKIVEERYKLPVFINNDANCFALGEFYFGKGKGSNSMIGLTIGTGLGTGIIIDKKLYSGATGGAGEFGMIDYLDKYYEYYASGQFFKNVYNIDGELVFKRAVDGDSEALEMYAEMGTHLGNAIKMVLYAIDVQLIILGGSVRHAFQFFQKTMWQQIETLAFKRLVQLLKIEVSQLENSGILGAAALCYDGSF